MRTTVSPVIAKYLKVTQRQPHLNIIPSTYLPFLEPSHQLITLCKSHRLLQNPRAPGLSICQNPSPKNRKPRSPSNEKTAIMGKVHGSLARAGKVKSQTPKVEPQEKKKTPKGRAKKRITYTRRFVNVTMTGGKRKMNPNPTS
ncbi:40S ribosomal protein S30 [Xanthoria parietina]